MQPSSLLPRQLVARVLAAAICLLALLAAPAPAGGARAAPALTLDPARVLCTDPDAVTARGAGFAPGTTVVLNAELAPPKGAIVGRATVAADGTFAAPLGLRGAIFCNPDPAAPAQQYTIGAIGTDGADQPTPPALASAVLTVASGGAQGDPDDDAWAAERARIPAEAPVYRPTWLPARFRQPGVALANGLEFGVVYSSAEGDRLLFGLTGNRCGLPVGDTSQISEPFPVHGIEGTLIINTRRDCAPQIGVFWQEAGRPYSIQGNATTRAAPLSREELALIVDRLAPVGADGRVAPRCFAETGRCVGGRFLAYWLARGGLAVNGLPLSEPFKQRLEDGNEYTVQYFERVRLELHPMNQPPYDVLLGQFGRRILLGRPEGAARLQPVEPAPGARYFPESGHNLGGRFRDYWEANGGLPQFGYPLSEPFEERLEDGNVYLVQYFERARFEYHPENAPPEDVQLGQFGRRILAESGR